ncbi:E3 ubiquitin-protein ligase RNF115-like isoform X2 [Uloborus diversus]|uniref:E3 ubiquitin-protein ligase RNF115-like isoform X2 n=1 Tax=Uloborus diversus TaxID=327109 RepID=UPI0024092E2F|nr:E3 ubiquitin-protein ligase RNF115-like isoform X2 [Uloborus diversus]
MYRRRSRDYICPRCQSGFIEELTQGPPEPSEESDEDVDPLSQVADLWNMLSYMRRPEDSNSIQISNTGGVQDVRDGRNRPGPSRRARQSRVPLRRQVPDYDTARLRTEGFLQQLVSTISENTGLVANTNFPVFLNLHSNPGDYAWGRGGWNAIITQLINQLDGTGPPPLPREKIDEIPMVEISQDQVDKNLQCTVCMEDFKLDELVRRLSCDHHFHNDCITPWLELHGTCPICRKLLNDGSCQEGVFSRPTAVHDVFSVADDSLNEESTSLDPDVPRRTENSNPHIPSVYDFTDEFD